MALLLLREKRVFALVILMIIALGGAAASTIGRQEDPTITNIFAFAFTPYPGAGPERVEALVTEKIEEELRQIPEIKTITSTSRSGISVVQVELSEFTPDDRIEQVWSEMRDALSDAAGLFPPGVPEPEFDNDRTGAFTVIFSLSPTEGAGGPTTAAIVESEIVTPLEARFSGVDGVRTMTSTARGDGAEIVIELSDAARAAGATRVLAELRAELAAAEATLPPGAETTGLDLGRLSEGVVSVAVAIGGEDLAMAVVARRAELLADQMRALPGTDFVRLYGAPAEEILVEIDPSAVAALGLTPDQVAAAVRGADAKVQAGRVAGSETDYLVEVVGEIDGVERVREIPIFGLEAAAAGSPVVRVGDVADVRRAIETPPSEISYSNGARSILVAVRMEPDLQVDTWTDRVKTTYADYEATAPAGVTTEIIFDQSAYTFERLGELGGNIALGIGIVIAVLLITLGWRSALIVALALPLTAMISLFVLQQIGVVVHQMSVTGLIVALGLLVDAAIVMTDDIRRSLREGKLRDEAVRIAVRRLTAPVLASTVTTVLTFVPMAGLPGPAGDFIGSVALAVITMLITSFLIAITVTPALAGMTLRREATPKPRRLGPLPRFYRWTLERALANRGVAALCAATPAILGFLAFPTLTAQFFPGVDRDQFYVQLERPLGASIDSTRESVEIADRIIREAEGVVRVDWVLGRNAPAFYYNMTSGFENQPEFAEALIVSASPDTTARLIPELQAALDAELPGAQTLVRGLVQGPPVNAPLEIRVIGPDLEILRAIGDDARRVMATLPMVEHTQSDLGGGAPKLVFDFDEEKLRLAGLTLSDAARQLETLLVGVTGGSLVEGSEELPVRVRVAAEDRASADRILALRIVPPGAQATIDAPIPGVPLSALGVFELAPDDSPISRRNGERLTTVQGFLQLGVLPEEALKAFRVALDENPLDLPPGYRIEIGGDADARGDTVANLLATLGIVVVAMVATIVLTFNSWRLSIIAFIVSGLSMGLSLLALAAFQFPFGIQALIGVIGSIGVSINAAIIIMSTLKSDPKARLNDRDAIVDVVMRASRHIVSTTVTTFGGFLPLILAGGFFWPPFAMSIAGGVLLSTIVSLYFTPPMFSLLAGRKGYQAPAAERRAEAERAPSSAAAPA